MLIRILALIVGFGSLAIYLAAFFFPEVHRKNDFIWSGVGLFYALVLWVFSPRIGGWFFLGQLASVALLVWFGLQTFSLRRQVTPAAQQTPVPSVEAVKSNISQQAAKFSLQERLGGLVNTVSNILPGKKEQVEQTQSPSQAKSTTSTTEEDSAATLGKSLIDAIDEDAQTKSTETKDDVSEASLVNVDNTDTLTTTEVVPEANTSKPTAEEVVETVSQIADTEEKITPSKEEVSSEAEPVPPESGPSDKLPKDAPKDN